MHRQRGKNVHCIRPTQDEGWVVKSTSSNSVMLLTHDGSHRYQAHPDVVSPDASETIYCWDDVQRPFSAQGTLTRIGLPTLLYRAQRAQRVPLPSHTEQHVALASALQELAPRADLVARYKPCNVPAACFLGGRGRVAVG